MAVKDYIKSVRHHRCGIPSESLIFFKSLNITSSQLHIDVVKRCYDKQVNLIDKALSGVGVPVDCEEAAASMVSHLIIDTAFIHNCLVRAGALVEPFPFDYLVDKLLPKRQDSQE